MKNNGEVAPFLAIQNLAEAGDNIVSSASLYGGSFNQFNTSFRSLGIEFRFAPLNNPKRFEELIDHKTKALFIETISNSDLSIPDFEQFAELSKKYGIPLIIDNTFGAAGYLFKPANYGAAVITHAATKWISGHGNSIAGVVVDSGTFNWDNGKFPQFTEPCASYSGLRFWERFGSLEREKNVAFAVRARALGLRDWGCTLSPLNSFLILQGMESLALRMDRALENSIHLAEWLSQHPKVESVNYPGLKEHPSHQLGKRYLTKGFGAVLFFNVKGGRAEGAKVVESLEMIAHLVNVGDNKSVISHSAPTTHGQLSAEQLKVAGIEQNSLRLSIGIEHVEDIKRDLDRALSKI